MGTSFDSPAGAIISDDEVYRYFLWRTWEPEEKRMLWVMLNPSTADGTADDATIRKCVGFAKRNNCGGIGVVNLFAYRSRDPKALKRAEDPLGPLIYEHARDCSTELNPRYVVMAWGAAAEPMIKRYSDRNADVRYDLIEALTPTPHHYALGYCKSGEPLHPVMPSYDRPLVPWPRWGTRVPA